MPVREQSIHHDTSHATESDDSDLHISPCSAPGSMGCGSSSRVSGEGFWSGPPKQA
ncbi:hypothetical protein HSEST_2120 [Halapricum desulfuricans]|uniref:Uncharacterized protein n=1 Tax=Halapricum desulfuricans TaxID=2841257 RepID=A0A897NVQ4_9EURY|nr:hypothetical protein HSEST_2120 [Halapricum desulfuricans]